MGILYLVATPIGNMEDITLRAIKTLKAVDLVLAEDTRRTGLLLERLGFKKPLLSYYEEVELKRIPEVLVKLKVGQNLALVSDSGTPTLSDPGFKLVRECLKEGIKVISVPGASAILTALTSSGLATDKFLFLGFLPQKAGKRKKTLENLKLTLKNLKTTVVFFEPPHRLPKTLSDLKEVFGDIKIVVCRELTKVHEEIRREKLSQAINHFTKAKPKGEFTLLFSSDNEFFV